MVTDLQSLPPTTETTANGGVDAVINFALPYGLLKFIRFICTVTTPSDYLGSPRFLAKLSKTDSVGNVVSIESFWLNLGYVAPGGAGDYSAMGALHQVDTSSVQYGVILEGLATGQASSRSGVTYKARSAQLFFEVL